MRRCAALLLLCLLPGAALSDDWAALGAPGAIAVMRHALAPGTGDPPEFVIGDCATQRNLDDRGRAQARAIGAAIRARGIAFDHVLTSEWCRTRESAVLLDLGPVEPAPPLNSFFGDFSRAERQTAETLELIAAIEGRAMLVSHQVNIRALTGAGTRSGEIVVLRVEDGAVEVTGRILIAP